MDFHPFDPGSGLIPKIADFGPLRERSGGRGIILIAVPDVETPSWCAQAAAALVTAWSARARIVLADVSLVSLFSTTFSVFPTRKASPI